MGTIIVALLAITMAILPISVPQAAMAAAHGHATVVDTGHEHAAVDGDHEHTDVPASSAAFADLSDHDGGAEDCTGPICCSMATCHAIQVGAPPSVYSPNSSQASMAMTRDEQVEGIPTAGPDRPPRTV
jgi:hypothetical protein